MDAVRGEPVSNEFSVLYLNVKPRGIVARLLRECYYVFVVWRRWRRLALRVGTMPNANLLSGQGGAPAREDVAQIGN